MKKTMTLTAAFLALGGFAMNDWENVQVNAINRLPARTYAMPLAAASCGPMPLAKYIFPIEKTSWTVRMSPVGK